MRLTMNGSLRSALLVAFTVCLLGAPSRAASSEEEPTPTPTPAPPVESSWAEHVVVTATRSEEALENIPLHITVIDRHQIEMAPEIGLRELFQRVPSLKLSSEDGTLSAGPSDSGLAFRGMGGTAQSRSLVLVDGLPINDPFGSYILWPRVPKDIIERIEVMPGVGGSWGNLALSGVVNLITMAPTDRALSATLRLGELATREATLLYSDLGDDWSGWVSGNAFDSDGYITLDEDFRAPIDEESRTSFDTFTGKLSRAFSPSASLHLSAAVYDEDRHRGTALSTDDSTENALSATLDLTGSDGAAWQVNLFGRDVGLAETEGLAGAQRLTETLNATLDVPSESYGLGAVRFSSVGSKHSLTTGGDLLLTSVEATTHSERVADRLNRRITTEGEQQFAGIFGQDLLQASPRLTMLFGARFDVLSTADGRRFDTNLETGQTTETLVIDRNTETTVNPSVGIVYAATSTTRLRSTVYTGFRAATASELFVDTIGRSKNAANPRLAPERLVGVELGVDFTPARRFSTRATGYWNEGRDLIERILIGRGGPGGSVIPPCGFVQQNAACRERQNLAEVRATGLEIEQTVHLTSRWRLDLFGTLLETEVTDNPANPALVGKSVLRTPEQAGTLSVTYEGARRLSAVARVGYLGARWNEADNTQRLDDRTLADLTVSRPIGARFTPFVGVTNLFDEEYVIAFGTDGPDLGAPRIFHAGVRITLR